MMVAIVLYAYAKGQRSSRGIERACVEDVAYRVVASSLAPDHVTINRFRSEHSDALAGLFSSVLTLCARAGMVKVGTIAVDGTKLNAPAPLLERFRDGLTTQEVAVLLARGNDPPNRTAAEAALVELVAAGRAVRAPLGDGALWKPKGP